MRTRAHTSSSFDTRSLAMGWLLLTPSVWLAAPKFPL